MELEIIGICPVCKKGKMVKGSIGYSCNYFKSIDDKCTFNIYHTYFDKEITREIACELIEKGETEMFNDFRRLDGSTFSAALKIHDDKVVPSFAHTTLSNKCPLCESDVEENPVGYACVNYQQSKCKLFIPKIICENSISRHIAETLLKDLITPFISGFKSNNGDYFQSRLLLAKDGRLSFNNILCQCPKCGADVYAGSKAYNCSNQKNSDNPCDFVIWKEILGREISPEEAIMLCREKQTNLLDGFINNNESISRKLILNEFFKVKII